MYRNEDVSDYVHFVSTCLEQGYEFVAFDELNKSTGQLAMRHDIDFDVQYALDMAQAEHELGVTATYFFLLASDAYNLLSAENHRRVAHIQELGHRVSLHFDPTLYQDFEQGFAEERKLFEAAFGEELSIISLHRPNEFFQQYDQPIQEVDHTYMRAYFRDIKYFSDSTGIWRFGHPFNSEEFNSKQSLHVLIHPIWWMEKGASNLDTLRNFFQIRNSDWKTFYSKNCKPFREITDELP